MDTLLLDTYVVPVENKMNLIGCGLGQILATIAKFEEPTIENIPPPYQCYEYRKIIAELLVRHHKQYNMAVAISIAMGVEVPAITNDDIDFADTEEAEIEELDDDIKLEEILEDDNNEVKSKKQEYIDFMKEFRNWWYDTKNKIIYNILTSITKTSLESLMYQFVNRYYF